MPRGKTLRIWTEREAPAALESSLAAAGYAPIVARLLAARGIGENDVGAYFAPSIAALAPPCELPGVEKAAEVILDFAVRGDKIVVLGDYDCDGVCATAILLRAIDAVSKSGVAPCPFLPERLTEGYGMNAASVARMLTENPDVKLVVTVDNGINSVREVALLKEKGVAVVVTDHHLPGDELPAADALVNPKVASSERLAGLCGAGVAFLLANALVNLAKEKGACFSSPIGGPLLVLAGLATVTDVMPLVGQNRILVSEALKRFRSIAPLGLRELFDRASRSAAPCLTTKDFGFLIGPRINAAGRLASGMEALELIVSTDREEARELARRVDVRNAERKSIEQAMLDAALERVVPGAPAQVIDLPEGHQGVAGIVAARILERIGASADGPGPVPVCVVVGGHGSARAPEGYNVRDAFVASAEALDRFGGHAAAGGFSVKSGMIDRFRELFAAACAAQAVGIAPDVKGVSRLDAWVSGADLTLELADWVQKIEPCGEANPEPLFGIRGVRFAEVRPLGAEGRHLVATFRDRSIPKAIWWNRGDRVEELRAHSAAAYDIIFTIEANDYMERHVELRLVDIVPSHCA